MHLTVCFGRFKKADFGNESKKKEKKKNKQTKENQKEKQGEVLRHWDLLQVETGVEDGGSSLTLGI